jgi:glycosyltransferase involved in cell wall biosynthesis
MPTITIITICFNNIEELKATCQSIDIQVEKVHEHWIIDGSKNDEIKNYLQVNEQPNYRKWICEPDDGIADAFNKGIKNATGDFIQFLNSGDILYDNNVIEIVQTTLQQNLTSKWLHGQLQLQRGGQQVIIGKPFDAAKVYRGMRSTFHPTMYVHQSLFNKYGNFSKQYKIAMDYDFLVRIRTEPFTFVAQTIAIFDNTGVSNNNYLASLKEMEIIYTYHCGKSLMLKFWQIRLKFLYYLFQTKLGKWFYWMKANLKLENF